MFLILTKTCSNDNIKTKEKIKGELRMILRMVKAENLAGVHTHTHTHTISLDKNNEVYDKKYNISLSGDYYDTG